MAEVSGIEWCDSSLSLWFGCTQLSPACDHCYAMAIAGRLRVEWNGPPRRAASSAWTKLAAWQRGAPRFFAEHGRRRRVFINHLSDFFDNQAEQHWRVVACRDFEGAPDLDIILVTKRPQNIRKMVPVHWLKGYWPEHVWVLVTGENQDEFDRRVAELLTVPGIAVRGVSIEPMLEPIDPRWAVNPHHVERMKAASRILRRSVLIQPDARVNWFVIGGESGSKARPMPEDAVAAMMQPLRAGGVPIFMKQRSAAQHPQTFKMFSTFPGWMQIREYPR